LVPRRWLLAEKLFQFFSGQTARSGTFRDPVAELPKLFDGLWIGRLPGL